MSEVLLVTGMSGAGRSTVSAALEDMGWFVIDNLPLELIVRVGELATTGSRDYSGVAFVVGRSGALGSISVPVSAIAANACVTATASVASARPSRISSIGRSPHGTARNSGCGAIASRLGRLCAVR